MQSKKLIKITRAALIAALYVAILWAIPFWAFGPIQFRPSEALTLLPLLFAEAIPGLFIGVVIANLFSPYGFIDMGLGGSATLMAAVLTRLVIKLPKKDHLYKIAYRYFNKGIKAEKRIYKYKIALGMIPPIVINALLVPVIIIIGAPDLEWGAYFTFVASVGLTQLLTITFLGIPLLLAVSRNKFLMKDSSIKC
ncbi:MAG: QueT transporter family protein [Firmicutes bacterium]|nr:QueT transporter family protein [Bacillota bacterium]